jgi:hypothetical protein
MSEIENLKSLISRMKQDYARDMDYKNKKIKFLEEECKRIYDPIREFWNIEKNEEMERLKKEIKVLKKLSPKIPDRYVEIETIYEAICDPLEKAKYKNNIMLKALDEASEYAGKDDVNGEAGKIAKNCLEFLFKREKV